MKKIILTGALALMLGSGCKKEYLNTEPTESVDSGIIFTTTSNADAALNGIYRFMFERTNTTTSNAQGKPGVTGILLGVDFMGEDLGQAGATWFTSTGEGNYVGARTDNSGTTLYYYRTFFVMIGNANHIIDNIDNASGSDADKARIKAEALTLRAYAYSYLVQFYGKRYDAAAKPNTQPAVPMPLSGKDTKMPRVSVEEVYGQIIKDLDAAIALNSSTRVNKSHANIWVAKGLRARVALTMQDYPNAVKFAKEVIDGNQFPLMDQAAYQTGFNNAPGLSEVMWASMPTLDQGDTFGSYFGQIAYNANTSYQRGNPKRINSALYAKIPATDVRKKMWEPTPTAANFPLPTTAFTRQPFMSRKFATKDAAGPSLGDVSLLRASEMYLILAEAAANTGQATVAQDALFALTSKRDLSAVKSSSTGNVLLDEIDVNRRVELWGEGFRYLDLKRKNLPLDRRAVPNYVSGSVAEVMQIPAGDPRWQFFIPISEMQSNPNIGEQNP
jgi:hypothetical protein